MRCESSPSRVSLLPGLEWPSSPSDTRGRLRLVRTRRAALRRATALLLKCVCCWVPGRCAWGDSHASEGRRHGADALPCRSLRVSRLESGGGQSGRRGVWYVTSLAVMHPRPLYLCLLILAFASSQSSVTLLPPLRRRDPTLNPDNLPPPTTVAEWATLSELFHGQVACHSWPSLARWLPAVHGQR